MTFNVTPWEGCMPALVTPFRMDGSIDEEAYKRNAVAFLREGSGGLVPTGHNGEEWALSKDEEKQIWSWTREVVDSEGAGVPVIAGIDAISNADIVEAAKAAESVGVDGVMITPPFYIADATDAELQRRYESVARAVSIKLVVYNNPRRTVINMSPEFIARLAEIDSVVAVKQSYRDFSSLSETIRLVGDKAKVYPGPASFILPSTIIGAKGYISTGPDLLGPLGVEYYHIIKRGELDRAAEIHHKLVSIYAMLNKVGTWPASLKAGLTLLGKDGGVPRDPVDPLNDQEIAQVRDILAGLGILETAAVAD